MEIENRKISEKLIQQIEDLKVSISEISVYDFNIYSSMELYYTVANKLNSVIQELLRYEIVVSEEIVKQNECLQYLLNEGLVDEVVKKINKLIEDGTMDTIINQTVFKQLNDKINTKVDKIRNKVIFMPVERQTESAPGDCSVIVTHTGKVIMIDTGASHSYYLINQELRANNITKIDYLIISHYHADHTQNLSNLQNDFDMTNTVYYLQKHSTKFIFTDDSVKNLIGSNTIVYPNNGDKLEIDNIKLTFFNCSQIDIDYYDSNSNNYNDYSMCCYLDCGKKTVLFSGDIYLNAQSRMTQYGWFRKVDVLKIEHHAYDATVNNDYIRLVNPKYAVASEGERALSTKITVSSEVLSLLNAMNCSVAWCGKEPVYYYFNEMGDDFEFNLRVGGTFKDIANYTLIYIDSSYTGISDGTFWRPYRTLKEALSEISLLKSLNIQIVPKNGSYSSDEHIRIANLDGTVKMDNITVRGFDVRNANIVLGNFTVTGSHARSMVVESSILEFTNLTLDGNSLSADSEYNGRGLTVYKSKVSGTNLNVSNKRIAIACYNNSELYVANLSGDNNENGLIANGNSRIVINTSTMNYTNAIKDNQKTSSILGAITNQSDFTGYLNNNDDLNNFRTINTRYVSKTGGITTTLINKPTKLGYSFSLEVKKSTEDGSIMQIIKSRHLSAVNSSSNATGIFVRTYTPTDGWANWYEISLK